MGVVKNLMVRVGADVRSLISGMKAAGSATGSTAQKMKVASVEMRKSIKDSFSTSRMSVKEYSAYVEKTKQDHAVATQSAKKLTEEIAHLTSVYDSIKTATKGIDLKKPLADQIKALQDVPQSVAELEEKLKNLQASYDLIANATEQIDLSKPLSEQEGAVTAKLGKLESKIFKLRKEMDRLSEADNNGNDKRFAKLQGELKALSGESLRTQRMGEFLRRTIAQIGSENLQFASNAGLKKLQAEIQNVKNELEGLYAKNAELQKLKSASEMIGPDNLDAASNAGLDHILGEIEKLNNQLLVTKMRADETGQKLAEMGDNPVRSFKFRRIGEGLGRIGLNAMDSFKNAKMDAPSAALGSVKRLWNMLKNFGGSMTSGIASTAAKILGIGRNASASTDGLEKMVRSIRNIGIVALGMRVFRGIFGELQSVVSNYISSNDALSASVSTLKAQLGQALAPAINMIIAVMQRLMPIIQTIASAISAVLTALFGRVKITTSGIRAAAGSAAAAAESLDVLSFDKINKLSDNSGGGGGGGGLLGEMELGDPPEWVKAITDWIEKMKEAFRAGDWEGLGRIFGEGINAAVDAINAVDIGSKIGTFVNNLFATLNSALKTIKFSEIGQKVGELITAGFQSVKWDTVGETVGLVMTALPTVIMGFIQNTNWSVVATAVSDALTGALNTVTEWFQNTEWSDLGEAIGTFVSNIKWADVFASLGKLMWEGFKAALEVLGGFIKGLGSETIIAAIFASISAVCLAIAGKTLLAPILTALGTALATALTSVITAIAGWPALIIAAGAAAIAALVLWLKDGGADVVAGFLQGIGEAISGIGTWLSDNVFTPFIEGFKNLFGIHSPSTVMEEQGGYVIEGLLNGISNAWKDITTFFSEKLEDLKETLSEGWEKIKEGASTAWNTVTTTIGDAWTNIKTNVTTAGSNVVGAVSEAWSGIKAAVSGKMGETEVTAATSWGVIQSDAATTNSQIENLTATSWANIRASIVDGLSGARAYVLQEMTLMQAEIAAVLKALTIQFTQGWKEIQTATKSSWSEIGSTVSNTVKSMQISIGQEVLLLRQQMLNFWSDVLGDAVSSITVLTSTMKAGFELIRVNTTSTFTLMLTTIRQLWQSCISSLTSQLNTLVSRFRSGWSTLQTNTENTWKSMVNNVTSQATSMAKELQRIMEALRKSLQNTWSSIASEAASGASQAASNAISGFSSMLSGIQSICSQIVSAVSSMCSQIEAMCAAALAAIERVRAAAANIPTGGGGGGDPTGGAGGTSMHLASGDITLGPTYARIGEAGTKAVLPLENNTSWMDTLAQRITTAGGNWSGPMVVQIYLSKTRKLAECVIKDINQITKTTGVCPIQV